MSKLKTTKATRKKTRVWMLTNDIRNVDIQNALEMKSHTQVANTLAGRENNRRVLQYLIKRGCPVEYLDIPERMKKEIMS
jgi:mannose/fructose/N-acetylgalactosamine-specific phosphotransferase system component IIB